VAPLLGALGSFFSGSATVSNLTFGPVQHAIAERLGLDPIRVLAMQTAGAAMGNMVCIHNIVAVAAVLGVRRAAADEGATSAADPSGSILRLTIGPMLVYALCAALVAV
jgi:lactate permease